jgi:hypothetical protein
MENDTDNKILNRYKTLIIATGTPKDRIVPTEPTSDGETQIYQLLEKETNAMSTEPWNKLDKRLKIQKLHSYAEKYGRENGLPQKEIKTLKHFFSDCLTQHKLSKVKDVNYDKDHGTIINIPGLFLNASTRMFTVRNLDNKASSIKSLTPKKPVTPSAREDDA